jgi:AcrR family transcriptional regulator
MGTVVEAPHATGKGRETRTRILDVTQHSIIARGFDAASIEKIAASAEIRSGSVPLRRRFIKLRLAP